MSVWVARPRSRCLEEPRHVEEQTGASSSDGQISEVRGWQVYPSSVNAKSPIEGDQVRNGQHGRESHAIRRQGHSRSLRAVGRRSSYPKPVIRSGPDLETTGRRLDAGTPLAVDPFVKTQELPEDVRFY